MTGVIPGDVRRHRLPRETPWVSAVGCAFAITLVLVGMGGTFAYMGFRHDDAASRLFGYVFGGIGLLVLASAVHQWLARRKTPETWLEVDTTDVVRGQPVAFSILQPGAADLQSIRMNVLCLSTVVTRHRRADGTTSSSRDVRLVHQQNVFEAQDVLVPAGEVWQGDGTFVVPADQPATGGEGVKGDPAYEWRLEIWGRVRRAPDVMHPFVIVVR